MPCERTTTHRQGRIYPHQQEADFSGEFLGDNIVIDATFISNVQDTEDFKIDIKTKYLHYN